MSCSYFYALKRLLIMTIYSVLTFSSISQENESKNISKHNVSLGYTTGWNSIHFIPTNGEVALRNTLGRNHIFRLGYRFNFNQKLFSEIGASLGFQTERSQIPVIGFGSFGNGVERTERFGFSRLDLTTAYQIYGINKHAFHVLGGAGVNRFIPMGSGLGYKSGDEYFYIQYNVKPQFTPFVKLGVSYQLETKREDRLGLRLFYNHGWKSFVEGSYSFQNENEFSSGRIESLLGGVHLGLDYTFTRNKKMNQLDAYQKENDLDRKAARKLHKFEKRAIDPEGRYVSVALGAGITVNKFNPRNDPFRSPFFGSVMGKISYEHGWKNNFFFDQTKRRKNTRIF